MDSDQASAAAGPGSIVPRQKASTSGSSHGSPWRIVAGLVLGVAVGLLFGEYCRGLQPLGDAYVGLLQMTVLPYLTVSLVAKLGRLHLRQARRMGWAALMTLLAIWLLGILLVVATAKMLPPIQGASFFSPSAPGSDLEPSLLKMFIPSNIFRSLADEIVPAVVVFCVLFGLALMAIPGKAQLLDLLDLCADGMGRINLYLIRLAPLGLFALTAAAAGTLRIEELFRLQAYLLLLGLGSVLAVGGLLPLLVSCLTPISYRSFMRAAQEPLMTAVATGKLFVVLPQIIERCEELLERHHQESHADAQQADTQQADAEVVAPSFVVPMAYPFPHLGKVLTIVFVPFAAWYNGSPLSTPEAATAAATGAVTSFASPLVSVPFLLDRFHLPQDLMPLFILPGFLTTRLADAVGVTHLMALTLVVSQFCTGRGLTIRWPRLLATAGLALAALLVLGAGTRLYLASTTLDYDLDDRLLSLELQSPHGEVTVFRDRAAASRGRAVQESVPADTMLRIQTHRTLRVGYHPDQMPFSYFNRQGQLVGIDIELMHQLASRLEVQLELVPWEYDTVLEQLESGEIDVVVGGLIATPERSAHVAFSIPYQSATLAVVVPDHRRHAVRSWTEVGDLTLAVASADLAHAARRKLPQTEIIAIASPREFFDARPAGCEGLLISAEQGAAWTVLHPEMAVVVPQPTLQRPVGLAVRSNDDSLLRLLDRWLDFERLDGSLEQMHKYWIEGGGAHHKPRRWSVLQDSLGWLP